MYRLILSVIILWHFGRFGIGFKPNIDFEERKFTGFEVGFEVKI